ncbi:hypothetical protein [Geotalea toluenoxydans]|uniref:hypothetical protein n=1 Tax=Geotalea toluenoxydans TaxID=421624 RepID=UPI0006D20DB3|nr:hypothetical protein [Geotalea toluenoxydans]
MRSTISLICIISALAANGATFAYGTEQHGKSAKNTHQMKKLHAIMPMLSTASADWKKPWMKATHLPLRQQHGKF